MGILKALLRFLFPCKDEFSLMSDKDLNEYMRIEHITYYDIFPPERRGAAKGDYYEDK